MNIQKTHFEENLENLFNEVKSFRTFDYFKEMLKICSKFRHLSPFNAMLVNLQKPGARYVLKEHEWKTRFDRGIKPNAQPLIILVPFGPVDYLFEIGDTENLNMFPMTDYQILEKIAEPFKTKGIVEPSWLNRLMRNCAYFGIKFDLGWNAAVNFSAKIEVLEKTEINEHIEFIKEKYITLPAQYLISVNKNASLGEQFSGIIHELGHFFCRHLTSPLGWEPWEVRNLPKDAKEFEAESIAWLICERLNIDNPSVEYLAGYLPDNGEIPNGVSVGAIMQSANEIWKLCMEPVYIKQGYLYKKDKLAKEHIDNLLKQRKSQKNANSKKAQPVQLTF